MNSANYNSEGVSTNFTRQITVNQPQFGFL